MTMTAGRQPLVIEIEDIAEPARLNDLAGAATGVRVSIQDMSLDHDRYTAYQLFFSENAVEQLREFLDTDSELTLTFTSAGHSRAVRIFPAGTRTPVTEAVPPAPAVRSSLSLADTRSSIFWARRHVVDVLTGWRVSSEVVEVARLIVSELATNAVAHVPMEEQAPPSLSSAEKVNTITIVLELFPQSVRVSVWDRNPSPPERKTVEVEAIHGRGMLIVEAASTRWGHYTLPSPRGDQGKVVWADIDLTPDAGDAVPTHADAPALPVQAEEQRPAAGMAP